MQRRLTPGRHRIALGFFALWFAACALLRFDGDVWVLIIAGAALALVILMSPTFTQRVPSSALSTSDWTQFRNWFFRPNAIAFLLPIPLAAVTYLGAAASKLIDPNSGLSGSLGAVGEGDPELTSWWMPLFASGVGLLGGSLILLSVVSPLRAAYDAVVLRSVDRHESGRLTGFVLLWCALALTCTAQVGAMWSEDEDSSGFPPLEVLRLLAGQVRDGTSHWWTALQWLAVGAAAAGAAVWWRNPNDN